MNRYYLEPASPLKSITNTTQLAPSHSLNAQASATNVSSTKLLDGSGSGSSNLTPQQQQQSLWSISLTPPNSSTRPNNRTNGIKSNTISFQQTFAADDNSLFNQTSGIRLTNNKNNIITNNGGTNSHNINNNNNNNMFNGNGIKSSSSNGTNGNLNLLNGHTGQNVITKNSLNLQTTSTASSAIDNNNKFTPDTDFVADFSSANIFNATAAIVAERTAAIAAARTATMPASAIAGGSGNSSGATSNGHGTANQNGMGKFLNRANGSATIATSNTMTGQNGTENNTSGDNNANANFADFEHNPIYIAAGKYVYSYAHVHFE